MEWSIGFSEYCIPRLWRRAEWSDQSGL